jgi:hypothetical protein
MSDTRTEVGDRGHAVVPPLLIDQLAHVVITLD